MSPAPEMVAASSVISLLGKVVIRLYDTPAY